MSRKLIIAFGTSLLDHDTMKALKVKVSVFHEPNASKVVSRTRFRFHMHLTVLAARRLLDTMAELGQTRVVLKWKTKAIWDGTLNMQVNMTMIAALLRLSFFPVMLGRDMRLMHKAKQCCNVTVDQLQLEPPSPFVMLQLIEEISGGTGSKETQRTWIRNSLAATLLEQGFAVEWVAATTETLLNTVATKTALRVMNLPPGKQRIDSLLKLGEDCSLKPPAKVVQAASKTAQKANQQPRKKLAAHIDPSEYQIEPGLFLMQNHEPAQQTSDIRNKGCGVILMNVEVAMPWIREGQVISADELAIVIPGKHVFQTTPKCEEMHIQIPTHARDHPGYAGVQNTGSAGLVRSKSSSAWRFSADDCDAAWKALFPEKPVPAAHDTTKLFQIQSLPCGCASEMPTKWSDTVNWALKPFKALGPDSWLVGSQAKPAAEFLTFNGRAALVKHIPPQDTLKPNPIIAGPLPAKVDKKSVPNTGNGGPSRFDP
eukprot:s2482_g4.t1